MRRTDNVEAVKEFLAREPFYYLNIMEMLANTEQAEREIYVDDPTSIRVVLIHTGYINYLAADDPSDLEAVVPLLETFGEECGFSGLREDLHQWLVTRYPAMWESLCYLYALVGAPTAAPVTEGLCTLNAGDVAQVNEHYTYRNDGSYIRLRKDILKRPALGIRIDGILRSWLLVHEDGSMGVMYTPEAYRGHGYAYHLTMHMMHTLTQMGKVPFVQIVRDNTKSMGLAEKTGMVRIGEIAWCGVKLKQQ